MVKYIQVKLQKRRGRTTIKEFNEKKTGVLNTCKKTDEGLDVKGLSVAIVLGLDSSKIKATQRRGRAIRFEQIRLLKYLIQLLIKQQKLNWFAESHKVEIYTS